MQTIVVAGDVDSGKSTLIGRILYEKDRVARSVYDQNVHRYRTQGKIFPFAFLLDSFQEEREGLYTLDTTQVFCKAASEGDISFVDVPGHEQLLKNMLTGSSYADKAVMVVDVRRSVVQQTRRHLFILSFLGVRSIVAVINKMDTVEYDQAVFDTQRRAIEDVSRDLKIPFQACIPIAAESGENVCKKGSPMKWFRGDPLWKVLFRPAPRKKKTAFRFPVQDVYSRHDGDFAVGEVIAGSAKRGERVHCLPDHAAVSIGALKVLDKCRSVVRAPESAGIRFISGVKLRRGMIVCKAPLPAVVHEFRARLLCVQRLHRHGSFDCMCSTQASAVRIKEVHSVYDMACGIVKKEAGDLLDQYDIADVVVWAQSPMVIEPFEDNPRLGRFVLKADADIVAVGMIYSVTQDS